MTEVGIRSNPAEDLYLILSALDDPNGALNADASAQGIDLQVLVKPLVAWIWYGTLILAGGSLIALWPSAEKRKVVQESPVEAPVPAGAA
jgi:cytochrome c biogenesis factor